MVRGPVRGRSRQFWGLGMAIALVPLGLLGFGLESARAEEALCLEQLPQRLDTLTQRPDLARSRWGVLIAPLDPENVQPLVDREGDRFFTPASTAKLLTTAAALAHFGPDHRWHTQLRSDRLPEDGFLEEVSLIPSGDPSLDGEGLQILAARASLLDTPLRHIGTLRVYGGDRVRPPVRPSWEWDDLHYGYGAPHGPAIVNGNQVTLTLTAIAPGQPLAVQWSDNLAGRQWEIENHTQVLTTTEAETQPNTPRITLTRRLDADRPTLHLSGGHPRDRGPIELQIAIPNPARHLADKMEEALWGWGIEVDRVEVLWQDPPAADPRRTVELASVPSPPLAELVARTNLESNNLYAEALYSALEVSTLGDQNSITQDVLSDSLQRLGIDPETYRLRDGSGLSRQDLVSPQALLQLLRAMARSPLGEIFRNSLPIAGQSGTLTNRFVGTPLAGQLRAKTGTLTGVSALAGYFPHPQLGDLGFAILVNQSDQPAPVLRAAMDEFLVEVARSRPCGSP
ncbi:MAG: D-alanyl-D-alanine carboxypeptidase/D-alanyl-D-alanine-endopeptidase [Cyanobacteria bacterium]|nr:D-alanyl-D-alanine carboxypeptidase/D-alanyl-D-alanine-endopeptidase [Cyanobacteriota bacterium]